MRMHQIEVDEEVFSYLQRKAQPFLDTPNTVLRRELSLRQATRASGSTPLGAERTPGSLPILPALQGLWVKSSKWFIRCTRLVARDRMRPTTLPESWA